MKPGNVHVESLLLGPVRRGIAEVPLADVGSEVTGFAHPLGPSGDAEGQFGSIGCRDEFTVGYLDGSGLPGVNCSKKVWQGMHRTPPICSISSPQ